MTKEEIIHCRDCIYFDRYKDRKTNLGTCHNQSPIIVTDLDHKTGQFPIVEESNYCGDAERISI